MTDFGVIVAGGAQMDDMLYASPLRCVQEGVALFEHIDRIACQHENAVDSLERPREEVLSYVRDPHEAIAAVRDGRASAALSSGKCSTSILIFPV